MWAFFNDNKFVLGMAFAIGFIVAMIIDSSTPLTNLQVEKALDYCESKNAQAFFNLNESYGANYKVVYSVHCKLVSGDFIEAKY